MRETPNCYNGLKILVDTFVQTDMNVLEIGSYAGESSVAFAKKCKTLYCVDPWSHVFKQNEYGGESDISKVELAFDVRTKECQNIHKIKSTSDLAAAQFEDDSIDFLYIDGLHTKAQVIKDIINYFPKVKSNGFIAGHDYNKQCWPGVVEAVKTTLGEPHFVLPDTSWVFKKSYFGVLENFFVSFKMSLVPMPRRIPILTTWRIGNRCEITDIHKQEL
jgi:hypothetical protein